MKPDRMKNRVTPLPAAEILLDAARKFFAYRSDGVLIYKCDPRRPDCETSKVIGKQVGGDDGHGYLMCMLLGYKFKVHQIVWLLHKGQFPKRPLDHVNRVRRDNRIENLREADDLENMTNLVSSTRPTSGTWLCPTNGKYCARFTRRNKKIYLGYFDTVEEANAAYREAKRAVSGDFSPV